MTRALLVLAILGLLAVPAGAASNPRLHAFSSCAALSSYARAHTGPSGAPRKGVPPTVPTPPAPSATGEAGQGQTPDQGQTGASSGTNVQEPGVDEPDLVKVDGTTMFTAVDGSLRAVDISGDTPALLSSVPIEGGGAGGGEAQILEHDGRLLVISNGLVAVPEGPITANSAIGVPGVGQTVLTEVDARDPAAMRVVRTMRVEGAFVDARQKDAVARVVLSSAPAVQPGGPVALPEYRLAYGRRKGGRAHHLVGCRSVLHPVAYDGTGLLTVLTIDLDRGLPPIDSDAIMTSAQVVYGSATSLYVATGDGAETTAVHKFATGDPTRTDYRASGTLPGELLDQYALSELDGRLRAATTKADGSESRVTVLEEQNGKLVPVGSVGGLGQGQRIYAVRFMGTTGYVVTFRQIDPLYTLDLSDPTAPKVVGQLELEGYSAYLHPVGDGLLLGIGQDASPEGKPLGVQLSLFDVSNPASPTLLQHTALGVDSTSDVENDPHAFLWWGPSNLAVIPVRQQTFTGALGFRVGRDGIADAGRVSHEQQGNQVDILRTAVVGNRLLTVSTAGVQASALDGLAPQGFLAFPTSPAPRPPEPGPVPRPVPVPEVK
jgi:hypothetical protein